MKLIEKYQQTISEQNLVEDAAQLQAIEKLQLLIDALNQPPTALYLRRRFPAIVDLCRISRLVSHDCLGQVEKGIYLWGGVGRGKTLLMHLFYESLPFDDKKQLHFHAFMQAVHTELSKMKKQKNPLRHIARKFSGHTRVLCLDEFIVTNITDAMLLSGLLKALFEYGVTLVATSNRIPDDLYLNGLQRDRFLPAIDLIKQKMHVFHLDNGIDHRLALLEHTQLYIYPASAEADQHFESTFQQISAGDNQENTELTVSGRGIKTRRLADEIVWFNFDIICSAPRAAQDYVQISQQFHTVFISCVPQMDSSLDDRARRFIYLIDALYDRNVKLFISADQPPESLYKGTMLKFAFQRTTSRLIEMRSEHYLKSPHLLMQDNAVDR